MKPETRNAECGTRNGERRFRVPRSAFRVLLVLVLALCGAASAARADEFDTLRLKWRDMLTQGTNASPADPLYAGWINRVSHDAQRYWNQMATNAGRTFLWSDLAPLGSNSLRITSSYGRLRAMALGHAVRGSSLETNAGLRAALVSGLDWMYTNHYNERVTNAYDNWFDWNIGTPLHLNDITVLMYSDLSAPQVANYMNAVNYFTPFPDLTGANEVWKASVVAVRGAIVKSAGKIASGRAALSDVFPYVTVGDGFHADGSFVFHDVFAYNGGYGAELIGTLGPLKQWLNGSTWEVTDPAQTNLFRWVHEAFQPLLYRGAMMQMASGRYYTRQGDDHLAGHDVIGSILRLAQFAPPADAAAFKRMVKEWITSDTWRDFIGTQPPPYNVWAQAVLNDTNIVRRGELTGHYLFPQMDRAVHLRPGWGFGLSMASSRIGTYESIRGENLRGWYTGEGMTYLYLADLDHFSDGYWPCVNPYRLPGTTVDTVPRANGSGEEYLSPNNMTGGASAQGFGVSAMHLNSWAGTLSARKSWFMFDNEVICLGAGINSTDNRVIETAVENRRLTGYGHNPFTVNGALKPSNVGWQEDLSSVTSAHLAGNVPGADAGYFFPQPTTVRAVREARAGALQDLNSTYGSDERVTRNFLTLWLDHGANPSNATYAYALLPNATATQVAAYAAAPDFTVIENTTRAQCVRENTLGVTAANFWRDAVTNRIGGIVCDRRASVLVRHDGTVLEVALADPTQTNAGVINLDLTNHVSAVLSTDPGVTVLQTGPLKLAFNVGALGGQSLRARFFAGPVTTLALNPVADTYAHNGTEANNNFGGAVTLAVKSSGATQARETFLRFDLASASGLLFGANLRLLPNSVENPIQHALALVPDNAWSESTLTWNNKPASNPEFTRWLVSAAETPVLAPVASLVQPAQAAGGKISMRISSAATPPPTNSFVSYRSRENGTVADRPQLILSLGRFPPKVALSLAVDPSIPLTDPFLFDAPATVTLTAQAQDADNAVASVQFFRGAVSVGQSFAPPHSVTLSGLGAGLHTFTAVATDATGLSATSAPVSFSVFNPEPPGRGTGLFGEYYTNDNLTGLVLTRTDMNVSFVWGNGSPAIQVPPDRFSVRWLGRLQTRRSGAHLFHTLTDEGVRLWVDGRLIIDRWEDHPLTEHTAAVALEAGRYYPIQMEYREKNSNAVAQLWWTEPGGMKEIIPQSQLYSAGSGLRGTYYSTTNLTNQAFTRIDPTVSFSWSNSTPDPALLPAQYSARWTGRVRANQGGTYTFFTLSDDGVRLTVNSSQLINNWTVHAPTLNSNTIALSAGQLYTVILDYFNHSGSGRLDLMWAPPGEARQIIPAGNLSPTSNHNSPPALGVFPPVAAVPGSTVNVPIPLTDPDAGQSFTFSLEGGPGGASIHPTTGLFSWTPPVGQPPGDYGFVVRVVDSGTPAMTDAQTLVVSVVSNVAMSPVTFIPAGTAWRYLDTGVDPGGAWRGIGFLDGGWSSGPAPLGYGGDVATTVSFGTDAGNKHITTWFRRPFFVPNAMLVQNLSARLARDDGAVVYLNGVEVWRENMPEGTITSSTLALAPVTGAARTNWLTQGLNPAFLLDGTNVVAVELHQSSSTGPDLRLDFELSGTALVPAQAAVTIVPSPGVATLVWPAEAGLLQLYTAANLSPPVAWLRATNVPVLSNGFWRVPLPVGTNGARFFRLQAP